MRILLYLLVFEVAPPGGDGAAPPGGDAPELGPSLTGAPRTLMLSSSHLCLALEDHVSYPLPDFVKGLPETPNYQVRNFFSAFTEFSILLMDAQCIDKLLLRFESLLQVLEIRPLESLRRIVTSDFQSRDLTLVFPDEKEEIVVGMCNRLFM